MTTRAQKIATYLLKKTTITPLVAFSEFGIRDLARPIFSLRNKDTGLISGRTIYTTMHTAENGTRYAEYTLLTA